MDAVYVVLYSDDSLNSDMLRGSMRLEQALTNTDSPLHRRHAVSTPDAHRHGHEHVMRPAPSSRTVPSVGCLLLLCITVARYYVTEKGVWCLA